MGPEERTIHNAPDLTGTVLSLKQLLKHMAAHSYYKYEYMHCGANH